MHKFCFYQQHKFCGLSLMMNTHLLHILMSINVMGYSRKNLHPHDRRHGFFDPPPPPHPPGFPKQLEPPSPQDFQVQRPPTHLDFHKIVRHRDFTLHSM